MSVKHTETRICDWCGATKDWMGGLPPDWIQIAARFTYRRSLTESTIVPGEAHFCSAECVEKWIASPERPWGAVGAEDRTA